MIIKKGDLNDPKLQSLLAYHFEDLLSKSAPETSFVLDLSALQQPNITIYTVWDGEELLGCGAIKELNSTHGEIKSMRTSPEHLRKGVARTLVQHMIAEAKRRKYNRLSLETGTAPAFADAQRLYKGCGFEPCDPFADYVAHEDNTFMTIRL